ncbi:hypothetical protein E3Q03_01885 [Wallemia mellicola]|uniref:Uncharacterized protein n=1 Tax=Wallemia mellicola TaxID=1708541 RepID=A0AB74KHA0_9BASI|nr:hypothetical protein E3Q03_01885 [Wallemia mellicola]
MVMSSEEMNKVTRVPSIADSRSCSPISATQSTREDVADQTTEETVTKKRKQGSLAERSHKAMKVCEAVSAAANISDTDSDIIHKIHTVTNKETTKLNHDKQDAGTTSTLTQQQLSIPFERLSHDTLTTRGTTDEMLQKRVTALEETVAGYDNLFTQLHTLQMSNKMKTIESNQKRNIAAIGELKKKATIFKKRGVSQLLSTHINERFENFGKDLDTVKINIEEAANDIDSIYTEFEEITDAINVRLDAIEHSQSIDEGVQMSILKAQIEQLEKDKEDIKKDKNWFRFLLSKEIPISLD